MYEFCDSVRIVHLVAVQGWGQGLPVGGSCVTTSVPLVGLQRPPSALPVVASGRQPCSSCWNAQVERGRAQ